MHSKSDHIEIIVGYETNYIIEELFFSFPQKYQKSLEELMNGSEFVFDSVDLLHYKCLKISLNRSESYTDSPMKCFQYAMTVVLNHKRIKSHQERITNIKAFINQHNWKEIDFPSLKNDWKKFETDNKIVLNILYVPYNGEDMLIFQNNSKRENQVVLLMITESKKMALSCCKKIVCTVLQNNVKA